MIVVTGATGHIGNVLLRELTSRGESVRVIVLPGEDISPLDGLKVEIAIGDIRDKDFLMRAFNGADTVYHLAGFISIVPGKKVLLNSINVEGTKNVVEACLKLGIKRLVYTSSIHAVKEPVNGITIDESCPYDPENVLGDYAKSKAQATIEVLKGIERGLNAIIVCPTGVIGPYDYKNSEMGTLIQNFMCKKLKMYIDGAYDFVDVRDVAHGLILACEKGQRGESYILSGQRISIKELLQVLQQITGVKAPIYKAPVRLIRALGTMITPFFRLFRTKPLFTAYSVDVLKSNSFVSSEKASRKLGYTKRPIKDSIADTVAWFKARKQKSSSTL
jgi:dihydroflavonol-4-reductase